MLAASYARNILMQGSLVSSLCDEATVSDLKAALDGLTFRAAYCRNSESCVMGDGRVGV